MHQCKVHSIGSPGNLTVQSTGTIKVLYSESEVSDFIQYKEKSIKVVQGNQVRKKKTRRSYAKTAIFNGGFHDILLTNIIVFN